jgi:hypothetical protein
VILHKFARLLRVVSIVICLIAAAYFLSFAVDQTGSASTHQTIEINTPAGVPITVTKNKEGSLHEAIDKVFSTLSSPFSGLTSSWSNQWMIHLVNTLLVLLIYGFGLAFLARLLRLGL